MKATELFNKANAALDSANLLLKAGNYDGCCDRAYYAMFDAAHGALVAFRSRQRPITNPLS